MINVGVIGVGNMGFHHARVYSGLAGANLVACSDVEEGRLIPIRDKFKCNTYTDYREMLAAENLDGVSIVVPTSMHREVAFEAMEKGISFLVEKPIASTVEDARSIYEMASEKNIAFLIGHIERFNPAVMKLKEMIDSGEMGDIITIHAKRVGLYPPQIQDSNIIVDVSIHDIEILNFLLGAPPDEIHVNAGTATGGKEDYVGILANYSGRSGIIQSNWITPIKVRKLYVTATKAYVELDYISQEMRMFDNLAVKQALDFESFQEVSSPRQKSVVIKSQEPLKLELSHFLEVVSGESEPLVTPQDGIKALEIAIELSNRVGSGKGNA
jgi:UDP-N-acetylglucosamine 3-dehydrogenase